MSRQKVTISLSPEKMHALDRYAEETGVSRSAIISLALDKFMRDNGTYERYEMLDNKKKISVPPQPASM